MTLQRFSKKDPCPVCSGFDAKPRGQGTRCDPSSRQEDLEEAKARVAYRRALLDGLDKKVASETTKILRGRN